MKHSIIYFLLVLGSAAVLSACSAEPTASEAQTEVETLQAPGKVSDTNQATNEPMAIPDNEKDLELDDRVVVMETNYGTLHIEMLDDIAPKTTENFIRSAHRKYYDGIKFHRMVDSPNMKIIQGGDPQGTGTGGQSAFGKEFEDEIMKAGSEELKAPEHYPDFDGQVATYQKGYIAMANRGPNTNGSQFFLMLGDTLLPPAYTIFGKVSEEDFAVLDKIYKEVKPAGGSDGAPDKELKMDKVWLSVEGSR